MCNFKVFGINEKREIYLQMMEYLRDHRCERTDMAA